MNLVQERGLIDDLQLEEVTQEATRTGKPISQILSDFGLVDTVSQLQIIADHLVTEIVDIKESDLTDEVIQSVRVAS